MITMEEDPTDSMGSIVAAGSRLGGPARIKIVISDPAGTVEHEYVGDLIEVVSRETMSGKRRQIHILIEEQRDADQ